MNLRQFSYLCLFILIFIVYLFINQYESAPVTKHSSHILSNSSPQIENYSFVKYANFTKKHIDRFRCPNGWYQFGSSCYYLSSTLSTPDKVIEMCHFPHINKTQLMYIRHSFELFYAAHILLTKNLTALLIQIDQQLSKNNAFDPWKQIKDEFYRTRLSLTTKRKSLNFIERNKNDDHSERFNNMNNLCDDISWYIVNKNSHIFVFTTYKNWDKLICSLTDMIPNASYPYLCEYVIDFCFENIKCGKHGQCINGIKDFKCVCSFFFDGGHCEEFSHQLLQKILATLIIALIVFLLVIESIRKRFTKPEDSSNQKPKSEEKVKTSAKDSGEKIPLKIAFIPSCKRKQREIMFGILFIVYLCPQLIVPPIIQKCSFPFENLDQLKSQLLFDNTQLLAKPCESKFYSLMQYSISFISILLTFIFVSLIFREKTKSSKPKKKISSQTNEESKTAETIPLMEIQTSSTTTQSSPPTNIINMSPTTLTYNNVKLDPGLLSPVNIDEKKDRYKIAAIFGLLTFEILKVFDEILLAINESSDDGILVIFSKRIFIILLIGCRYYSILISIRLEHFQNKNFLFGIRSVLIGLLRLFYIIVLIAYRIYRESICLDFMPHSENFSAIDEIQLRFTLANWFIFYGSVSNLPHFIFLSYIAADFSMYFMFDLVSKNEKKKETESTKISVQTSGNKVDNRTSFEKFRDRIYKWDETFLYSTLSISTYTINFIILFHLLHTFIFLYTTRPMAPISFMINIFEEILQIQIKETLFHTEICLSAVLTAIIYGIQLFLGLKRFRHDIKTPPVVGRKKFIEDTGINETEARSKAIQYPGYLIRYTFGGFIITFHLLIFILFLPHLLIHFLSSFKWIYELLIPIALLYLLQFLIVRLCVKMININHNEESSSEPIHSTRESFKENLRNILQYLILVANCFIGIMSSIILLIKALIFNILCMNRTDSCLFPEALENLDSANRAYWCFVYEQISFVQIETAHVLPGDLHEPARKDEEINDDKLGYEAEGENFVNTSSIDKNIWTDTVNLRQNWGIINKKRSPNEPSNFRNAKEQLHAIGLKKMAVLGDGNCFFRAVAVQLNQHENQHLQIRSQAIEYLKTNRLYFGPFIDGTTGATTDAAMETYIQRMSQNRTYVDHVTILATAAVLQKNIIIHSQNPQKPLLIPSLNLSDSQLHLWYDSNREHYDRVVCLNGNSPYLPPEQCLST